MAYVDPQFNEVIQDSVVGSPALGVTLGTVTASATQTYTGAVGTQVASTFRLPVFKQPVKILGVKVYCTTVASGGVSGVNLGFYNGTTQFALATNVGAALGAVDATMVAPTVASNGAQTGGVFFTSTNGEPIMINTATGTASGGVIGSYAVDFIWTPLFVS